MATTAPRRQGTSARSGEKSSAAPAPSLAVALWPWHWHGARHQARLLPGPRHWPDNVFLVKVVLTWRRADVRRRAPRFRARTMHRTSRRCCGRPLSSARLRGQGLASLAWAFSIGTVWQEPRHAQPPVSEPIAPRSPGKFSRLREISRTDASWIAGGWLGSDPEFRLPAWMIGDRS